MDIQTGAHEISNIIVDKITKRLGLPQVPVEEEAFCEYFDKSFNFTVTGKQIIDMIADVQDTMFSFIKDHPQLYETEEETKAG